MKTCFKCGVDKALTEFYKHPQMADGRLNKCKECAKKDVRQNRAAKLNQYRDYDKQRQDDRRRSQIRESSRRQYENDPDRFNERVRRWRENNPEKVQAHWRVADAKRAGRLTPKPCAVCGSAENIHAHHEDYSKPLEVIWLCPLCHAQRHKDV